MDEPRKTLNSPPQGMDFPMKAMSPGVVDFLFRRLVGGKPAEDVEWLRGGPTLAEEPAGAELARRLGEAELDALTPLELFEYVRAAQRLEEWAGRLREVAVARYCSPGGLHGGSPA